MKCPLKNVFLRARDGTDYWEVGDCLKEECAWWMHNRKTCAIYSLAWDLLSLRETAIHIHDKIPYGGN